MHKLKLSYRPLAFINYTRELNGHFPEKYSELSPDQFIAISRIINGSMSEIDFLHVMTGFSKSKINKLSEFDRYNLVLLFEPFTEIQPYNTFIIPYIKTSRLILNAPRPKLAYFTFVRFVFAESYFTEYQETKDPLSLHKFIACLYVEDNHAFDDKDVAANALLIAHLKPEILDAIVINYALVKEWIAGVYPMIFSHPKKNEDEIEEPMTKKKSNSSWLKILENVVGDDLINHDRYAMLPLHNVLRWMTAKIVANLKRK